MAAVRFTDIVIGGVTGALVGLLAWPQGGTGELRRACSRLLDQGTRAVTEIIDTITGAGTAGDALARARLAEVIAEASYVQYATERGAPDTEHPAGTDFQAIMLAGDRAIAMGQTLIEHCLPGALAAWPDTAAHLRDAANHLRLTALSLTYDLRSGKPRPAPVEPADQTVPTDHAVIADVCAASGGRARPAAVLRRRRGHLAGEPAAGGHGGPSGHGRAESSAGLTTARIVATPSRGTVGHRIVRAPRYLAAGHSFCSPASRAAGPGGCCGRRRPPAGTEVVSAAWMNQAHSKFFRIPAYANACSAVTRQGVKDRPAVWPLAKHVGYARGRQECLLNRGGQLLRQAPSAQLRGTLLSFGHPSDTGVADTRTSLFRSADDARAGYASNGKVRFSGRFCRRPGRTPDDQIFLRRPLTCVVHPFAFAGVNSSRIPASKACLALSAP